MGENKRHLRRKRDTKSQGLAFLAPLASRMTSPAPADRPTAAEVLELFRASQRCFRDERKLDGCLTMHTHYTFFIEKLSLHVMYHQVLAFWTLQVMLVRTLCM
ncbi:hypothetical protein BOTBODRAFT_33897 [Botryobasidium botryosum FD-172 SS1]|uniref:Uncharacterized protein n=1 Tax=Botryobasidium botryosum (strain FD-172 SS1) TaxID=930990 RepID=A0A067ME73_BOTB1|nr:hypothetical protein BOTBODRAFT_33897 [Botryobasidium botryosum FD-172 SS1]